MAVPCSSVAHLPSPPFYSEASIPCRKISTDISCMNGGAAMMPRDKSIPNSSSKARDSHWNSSRTFFIRTTVLVSRMPHGKWREYKQQLSCWPDLSLLVCSFVSLHFLWGNLHTSPVFQNKTKRFVKPDGRAFQRPSFL